MSSRQSLVKRTPVLLRAPVLLIVALSTLLLASCGVFSGSNKAAFNRVGDGDIAVMVPKGLVVRGLDGRALPYPSKRDRAYEVRLTPGQHTLVAEYVSTWNKAERQDKLVPRNVQTIRWPRQYIIHQFIPGERYRLHYNQPNTLEEAKAGRKEGKGTVWLESSAGLRVDGQVLNSSGFFFSRQPVPTYNTPSASTTPVPTSQVPAPVVAGQPTTGALRLQTIPVTPDTILKAPAATASAVSVGNDNTPPLSELKRWWGLANDADRREFQQWITVE